MYIKKCLNYFFKKIQIQGEAYQSVFCFYYKKKVKIRWLKFRKYLKKNSKLKITNQSMFSTFSKEVKTHDNMINICFINQNKHVF